LFRTDTFAPVSTRSGMRAVPTRHVQSLNEGCEVCTVFIGTAAVSWQAGED